MVVDLTTEDPTAMDIDADPIPSERSRKRRTVATAPLKRSRSERIQHIRDDYHAASPTDLMAEGERSYVASPVLTPSSCGSSASFADRTQHEASPAPEQDSTAADFSLALALQQEEEERMRNNWGFRLSDETQDDIGDGSTLHDAEVAAYLHEQEEALRMKMSKPQMRMCVICSDEMHPLDFPAKPPSRECTHTVNTCTNCLEKWVATDLDGRGWERISCPECGCALDHNDIHRAAAPEVFARYDQLATRGVLGADEHFHWCINAGCTSGQIHDDLGGESPVFACATCGFRQCIKHRMAWHDGETCEQYDYRVSGRADADRRAKEDQASEAAAAATTQTCPKATCKAKIQKSDGCDHMSCKLPPIIGRSMDMLTLTTRYQVWHAVLLYLRCRLCGDQEEPADGTQADLQILQWWISALEIVMR